MYVGTKPKLEFQTLPQEQNATMTSVFIDNVKNDSGKNRLSAKFKALLSWLKSKPRTTSET